LSMDKKWPALQSNQNYGAKTIPGKATCPLSRLSYVNP
jgi:hypothetical protein